MTQMRFDVVVVGAGIVGCAAAYALSKRGLKVAVLDKDEVGGAVSGASLACVGTHMVSRDELPFVIESCRLWRELAEELGQDFEYVRCGQMRFIASEEQEKAARRWLEAELNAGLSVELLSREDARRIVPALEGPILGATWSPQDATVNPFLACRALITAAAGLGAAVFPHRAVQGLTLRAGRIEAVQAGCETFACGWVVNAAGPWAADVSRRAGTVLALRPRKAQCLATETLAPAIPCVVGACEAEVGVEAGYTQIQQARSGQVLFNTVLGATAGLAEVPETVPEVDRQFVIDSVRTLLFLFPSLAGARLLRSWVRYEAVTPDGRFLVGPLPQVANLLMAAGDAGTGFIRAPLIGRLLAELVCDGSSSHPLGPYDPARFAEEAHAA